MSSKEPSQEPELHSDSPPHEAHSDPSKPANAASHPKKKKQRRPQTEAEYQHQLDLWRTTGPQINTETWLYEKLDQLDPENRAHRVKILHACEKAYYERDWNLCLQMCHVAESLFGVELDSMTADARDVAAPPALENKKTRKSSKVERHVFELHAIKLRCLQRIEDDNRSR
ncbi:uncharacterized protein LODBEIA_P49170 [Lodderomyces beijingensis]|uniref:Uncharacterized protein n=1 Tax=Lodderomyces beijingensis TaxID=1775926 RepID=A0ABP0ZRA6_9ASCO